MSNKEEIRLLIGIDDTDNAESRGTGFNARQLAHILEKEGLGRISGITRHQLFVHPDIPYTSKNSSACINIQTGAPDEVKNQCRAFLLRCSAPGSDSGLCIIRPEEVSPEILEWGQQAKQSVLKMADTIRLAKKSNLYLEGFTGNQEGIIGALAAVSLHAGGNDGRYIWRKGIRELREMQTGIFTSEELTKELMLDEISSLDGVHPKSSDRIAVNEWIRPILKNNKAVLITERTENEHEYEWKLTGKEVIRNIS
ncbi:MAG: hypothetical protein V2I47_09530 [Bacteroidales bacterium]|jgi:hypothetical protein|nr:hypothetical protein [Bacteroidales bacterium]